MVQRISDVTGKLSYIDGIIHKKAGNLLYMDNGDQKIIMDNSDQVLA